MSGDDSVVMVGRPAWSENVAIHMCRGVDASSQPSQLGAYTWLFMELLGFPFTMSIGL